MEKLEKHIKKTLEERRIDPSAQAWKKVSSQIKMERKKVGNKRFVYLVAASFIGIILVSIFFFRTETKLEITPQVAEKQNSIEKSLPPDNDNLIPLEIRQNATEVAVTGTPKRPEENSILEEVVFNDFQETMSEVGNNQLLNDDNLDASEGLIAQKVNEVIVQVALLETINNKVSDAEVDSLLRAAQQQILIDQILKSDKVDAMALLTEVEDELDESFRDQIFEALKDGYFKLRTAVADRNN